jgi:hypothetical protein
MNSYAIVEIVLVFGGTLAFVAWQLWDVKKARLAREAQELPFARTGASRSPSGRRTACPRAS